MHRAPGKVSAKLPENEAPAGALEGLTGTGTGSLGCASVVTPDMCREPVEPRDSLRDCVVLLSFRLTAPSGPMSRHGEWPGGGPQSRMVVRDSAW
jgi:hypothetical protein